MAVMVDWDNPNKTVLRYQYIGQWTWQENEQAASKAFELAKDAPGSVNIIADFIQSSVLPNNLLSGFQRTLRGPSIEFSTCVIVSKTGLLMRLLEVFRRLNRNVSTKLLTAGTVEEARALL